MLGIVGVVLDCVLLIVVIATGGNHPDPGSLLVGGSAGSGTPPESLADQAKRPYRVLRQARVAVGGTMSYQAPPPPPMQGGGMPPASGPYQQAPQNGMGTAALVMGILQFFCLGIIGSILAIVFGKIGMNKADQGLATNRGSAKAGFVLGIIGLILGIIAIVIYVILIATGAVTFKTNVSTY